MIFTQKRYRNGSLIFYDLTSLIATMSCINEGNEHQNLDDQSESPDQSLIETKLYKKRWALIALLAFQAIAARMIMTSMGVINNIYKMYFDISYYVIDWFTFIQIPAMILGGLFMAVMTFYSVIDSRKLFILLSSCATFSYVCSLVSFASTNLYGFIFFGQFIIGFGIPAASAIASAIATNWFPENQIASALNFRAVGFNIGCSLGYLIPSQIFNPEISSKINLNTSAGSYNISVMKLNDWHNDIRNKFLMMYGCIKLICIIIWILVLTYAVDKPPKPPTVAQALKPQGPTQNVGDITINMVAFYKEFKVIVTSKLFVQLLVITSIFYGCNDLQKVLMGEIFRKMFMLANHLSERTSNAFEGYALMLFETGAFLGGFVSGYLIDKFRYYKATLCIFLLLHIFSVLGLILGHQYPNITLPVIFTANTLQGVAICGSFIVVLAMVLQHTHPKNPALLILIFEGSFKSVSVVIGEISRLLLNFINGLAVFVFMFIILLLAFIVAFILEPSYQRQSASTLTGKESEPLLTNIESTHE